MYWWDPLSAAAAISGRLVTYEPSRLTVVQAFENHFLAKLNGRGHSRGVRC